MTRALPTGLTGCRALLVVTLMVISTGESTAQERSGLMGGISLGAGALDFSGTSSDPAIGIVRQDDGQRVGLGVNIYLGAATSPRTAFLVEVAATGSRTDSVDGEIRIGPRRVTFTRSTSSYSAIVAAGAVQYWVAPRVWLRGGLGAGFLDRELVIEEAGLTITLDKGTGFAVLGAAGIEVWRHGRVAMDTEFHVTSFALEGLRINAPSVHVGFTWY